MHFVCLEALKLYASRPDADFAGVMTYAKVCRVKRIMQPYVEALQ